MAVECLGEVLTTNFDDTSALQAFRQSMKQLFAGKKETKEKKEKTKKEKPPANPQRDSQLREAAFHGSLCRVRLSKV